MMEELGYFPVSNAKNEIVYVPARLRRDSSAQATALADYMRRESIVLAGAYWCPHCRRQRELFGRQANVPYVECAADGYQSQAKGLCRTVQSPGITGFPTWLKGNVVMAEGEMPLDVLAKTLGYPGTIDPALEVNVPPPLGAASCAGTPQ